jgi:hypothetical protein
LRLRAFRELVESEQNVRRPFFDTPDELAAQVSGDLARLDAGSVRPTFGPSAGRIRDRRRYSRASARRSTVRSIPFPVTLVNLATMHLDRYPGGDSGGRLVVKLLDIENDLLGEDIQASIFNNLSSLSARDTPLVEQRLKLIRDNSALVVCFAKTSEDLPRLAAFEEMTEKLVVWHPAGTELPADLKPKYSAEYTPEDLAECELRIDAQRHIADQVNARVLEELGGAR